VKDRIFSGADVEEALAAAGATLGLPIAKLRYVVLEAGMAGGRGLQPTPARIAVLIQEPGEAPAGRPQRREGPARPADALAAPLDPRASLRAIVRAVAEAGNLALETEIEETAETLVLKLRGEDYTFFHGDDGRGEVLLALEHLLQRIHGPALEPLSLRVRCDGFRERRDAALSMEARQLADAVRTDGAARTMAPLNAYERRIVHLALQDDPSVTTFSVGEGRDRRVTVALRVSPAGESTGSSRGGENGEN
jgi:spoIIIJ-associated protein